MEPMVTISLDDYNKLKDLEYQFSFLLDKIDIVCSKTNKFGISTSHPLFYRSSSESKIGKINKNDLDLFYKNLLDIDELEIIK